MIQASNVARSSLKGSRTREIYDQHYKAIVGDKSLATMVENIYSKKFQYHIYEMEDINYLLILDQGAASTKQMEIISHHSLISQAERLALVRTHNELYVDARQLTINGDLPDAS